MASRLFVLRLTNEALLSELEGETTCDLLQLMLGVLLRVDLDTGLSTTEWYIDARTLECHQSRKGLDLIPGDIG